MFPCIRQLKASGLILAALPATQLPCLAGFDVQPFLEAHCIRCHGGEKVKGKVDFTKINGSKSTLAAHFVTWELAAELVEIEEMPPEDEDPPSAEERAGFIDWYRTQFIESVEAQAGPFQPRRLSAIEYRNTLRSLFGFDLEVAIVEAEQTVVEKSLVMKLLPTDPPGASGFTNDTHGNPLSTVIWDQYSYLTDAALEELFSRSRRADLEKFSGPLSDSGITQAEAEQTIRGFVPRAWRRSLSDEEIEKFVAPLDGLSGKTLVAALKTEMKTALMAPSFLYRGLLVEGTPGQQQAVDDFELAERLSYFLWADQPDDELSDLAANGKLSDPHVLAGQIERMLDAPTSRSLAEVFARQWLALGEIEHVSNNPPVSDALTSQPIDLIDYLFRENRPLIELIDSPVTFINVHTAKFYPKDRGQMKRYVKQKGIEVESVPNQRIRLENTAERGGILTMPGVLAMNKGPVIRGTWILERILGDHLGDPPADVGVVAPNRKGEKLSFRERFEEHRSNQNCAVCHDKIDPLGFAMQRYNAQGGYIADKNNAPVDTGKKRKKNDPPGPTEALDTSGQLPSGEVFKDFAELKKILTTSQRETIIRNLVEKTLSYALCRRLEVYDQPTVTQIVASLETREHGGTYRDLVHEVVDSLPFRQARFPDTAAKTATASVQTKAMTRSKLNRRSFLRGAAGAVVPLPFLNLMEGSARAASGTSDEGSPLRFMTLFKPNGVHPPSWNINGGTENDFRMSPLMQPFAKHKNDLLILDNMGDFGFSSHANSTRRFLSGHHKNTKSASVDQLIADKIGGNTPHRSLELTTEGLFPGQIGCSYISYDGKGQPMPRESDPQLIFDRLFRSPMNHPKERREMDSLLDRVSDDAKSLKRKAGREDQQTLDEYLTVVRETEQRLENLRKNNADSSENCNRFRRPSSVPSEPREISNEQVETMIDLVSLSALWTDSTRCASYMLGNSNSRMVFDFLGIKEQHHYLSHFFRNNSRENLDALLKISLWHMEKFGLPFEPDEVVHRSGRHQPARQYGCPLWLGHGSQRQPHGDPHSPHSRRRR